MAQTIPIPLLYFFIALVFVLELVEAQVGSRVSLQTHDGGVFVGLRDQVDRSRREFYAFTGIPYAKPPIGTRRFQEAELLELGQATHYATAYGPECPQYDYMTQTVKGSENCLYLSVFTPHVPGGVSLASPSGGGPARVPLQSSRPLLPVIVFIHGGSFQMGSGDVYGPKRFMRDGGVVLVTINYRLGALGYLSIGEETISGNQGSLDQIVALKWIEKYIRDFGGNPHRVTLVGSSAGAAMVHALMLSPRALGLFHGAILQSGSALCDWAINENPREYAEQLGEAIGCPLEDSYDYHLCLLDKTVEEIVEAQVSLQKIFTLPLKATLVVDSEWRGDDAFLPADPKELMEAGAFAQVPVIAGVAHDEGLGFYAQTHIFAGENFKDQEYFENTLLPDLLTNLMDNSEPLSVTIDAVKAQYFQELDVVNETKRVITELTEMLGDVMFQSCHWDTLEKLATGNSRSPVYSYVFSHKTPSSPSLSTKDIMKVRQMGIHHPLFNYGIAHGDELFYLFDPVKGHQERMGTEDERVADMITRAWVSFATTGSPASGLQLTPNAVPWRPIKPGNINYYNLTSMPSPMGEDFRKGEALFWLRTLPYIQELGTTIADLEDYPTYFWIALGVSIFLLIVALILVCLLCRSRSY